MMVAEAILRRPELGRVLEVQVRHDGKFWRINRRRVLRQNGMLVEMDAKYRCTPLPIQKTTTLGTAPSVTESATESAFSTVSAAEARNDVNIVA